MKTNADRDVLRSIKENYMKVLFPPVLMHLPLPICIILLCLVTSGCLWRYIPNVSGGGSIREYPNDDPPSSFRIEYENWIEFAGDLTVSVDSVFAKLEVQDEDTKAALRDFLVPADRTLYDECGITMKFRDPIPDNKKRKFFVATDYSEWKESDASSEELTQKILKLIKSNGQPKASRFRWRGKLQTAEVEFNTFSPRRLFVRANFIMQLQVYSYYKHNWQNVDFDHKMTFAFGDRIRRKMNRGYYEYLETRYDMKISSAKFRGTTEPDD